jgi:dephospho-CoA kinase
LTGGVACGKSAVADLFAEQGACIIDTDLIAREVVEPGETGLQEIIRQFGSDVLLPDGRLDRRKMRELIFSAPEKKATLEAILHPLIRARSLAEVEIAASSEHPYVILVVPLLVETGFAALVDRIAVVDIDPELQLRRLMQRDGMTAPNALQMIGQQANRAARLRAADDIIDNNGSFEELRASVAGLHAQYLELAAGPPPPKY